MLSGIDHNRREDMGYNITSQIAFDSISEMLGWFAANERTGQYRNSRYTSESTLLTEAAWFNETLADALQMARDGDPVTAAKIAKLEDASDLVPIAYDKAPAFEYGTSGPRCDVYRYAAGDPHCMTRRAYTEVKSTPIIRLEVIAGMGAATSQATMYCWGAALAANVDALEEAGYRVEIVSRWHNSLGSKEAFDYRCMVKRADDPLDKGMIAFVFANAAWLRRVMFQCLERDPANPGKGSYGSPINARSSGDMICAGTVYKFHQHLEAIGERATVANATRYVNRLIREALELEEAA
jgi:hypothetical protein